MPALSPDNSPLVLVTGANGYAASHIIHALLNAGYRVRGTVRSESSRSLVKDHFSTFGDALAVVLVPDITVVRSITAWAKDGLC
jgi:nucleoside-diphosphate-sugar epimerase